MTLDTKEILFEIIDTSDVNSLEIKRIKMGIKPLIDN